MDLRGLEVTEVEVVCSAGLGFSCCNWLQDGGMLRDHTGEGQSFTFSSS